MRLVILSILVAAFAADAFVFSFPRASCLPRWAATLDSETETKTEEAKDADYLQKALSVVVVGASGDLAMKMTYPALYDLYTAGKMPEDTIIYGFSRSEMSDEDLREKAKEGLPDEDDVDDFLKLLHYNQGEGYDHEDSYKELNDKLSEFEEDSSLEGSNRLFYLAVPPNAFGDVSSAIKKSCTHDAGFNRIVMEKPFGKDLESFKELDEKIGESFDEESVFRIDHFLGHEMVQNLMAFRFGNTMIDSIMCKDTVQCIIIEFKENFDIQGRGGYFDEYGIVRDMLQNHLLQVMTILTMEAPEAVIAGDDPDEGADEAIRDARLKLLKSVKTIELDNVLLGQYEGYTDDESVENKESKTPTFAAIKLDIDNDRWQGVPIILKVGKSLDENRGEMRVQFKDPPNASIFGNAKVPRNELVITMEPSPRSIHMAANVKGPGQDSKPTQTKLDLDYNEDVSNACGDDVPDAYPRLMEDVLVGSHSAFVRADELERAWEIYTPVLHEIEEKGIEPYKYEQGSSGPEEVNDFLRSKSGYECYTGPPMAPGEDEDTE